MMKKLLLADDSITIQKVVGIILSTEEYQLEITDDGDRAFTKALEEIPDLVIADVSMPGKDGFELCRAIKSEPSLSNTSVLLLPGAFDHFDEAKAGEVCADGWLTKPFESQSLLDKVSQLLEAKPVRMAGTAVTEEAEPPLETQAETLGIDVDTAVSEELLGLDAVDSLALSAADVDEESPDDIWDAVSFAEEDLQGQVEPTQEAFSDEVSFAADVIDPAAKDEAIVDPVSDKQVFSALEADVDDPVAEVESNFVEEPSDLGDSETFQSEPFAGVDLSDDKEVVEFGEQHELASEVISPAPVIETGPVDFSVYSEEDEEIEKPAADAGIDEGLTYISSPTEEEEALELTAGDLTESSAEEEPVEEEPVEEEPVEEEPASFAVAEDEVILELQEEDASIADEAPDLGESFQEFGVAPVEDISADDEIYDLSEEDIVETVIAVEPEPEPEPAPEPEPEPEPELEPELEPEPAVETFDTVGALAEEEVELVEDPESSSIDDEDDNFYFDETVEDGSDLTSVVAGGVGIATGVAAAPLGHGESVTEQVEQQLRELSEDELKEIVTKVAGPMIEKLAGEMLEKIAWEVVPDLAEAMISEEIRKIKDGDS
jgi:CheY-like chemotaxis protein